MNDPGAQRMLDAVISIAHGATVPEILDRVAGAACALTGAPEGVVLRAGAAPPEATDALVVPIEVRGERFGEVRLTGKQFTESDAELVRTLLTAAGGSIGNAALFEQSEQRERWLRASHDVTSALLAGEDPEATLRLIAERARLVAGATAGGIARPTDETATVLEFAVVEPPGPDADRLTGLTVPADGTATGMAFTTGEPVVVRRYGDHVTAQQAGTGVDLPQVVGDLDSAVAVPLRVGDETLGVLVVAKLRDEVPFTDTEVRLALTFGAHAALAMEFARAEQDRQRLAVLEDRDRIARDLHDLVVQRLFAIALGLESTGLLLDEPRVAERLRRFVDDLDATITEVRNSIFALQQPAEGLRSRIARACAEAAPSLGFEPRVGFTGAVDAAVPSAVETDLFATLREALSNVARHSRATKVSVTVAVDGRGDGLRLTVADNGIGIPAQPTRRSGLENLAARAARWHGTSAVQGEPDRGTTLDWVIRLPEVR
ncbi:Redox sensor histidine kinase response regulator DevS [Amycolatopsis sp. YIM 10]|nr:GAF domain-containing protein [Amycolatopsis sp. YIM 10]QFU85594.1 Redox sensor histidine kinase response regulator DevS [Amycolatopsis sp. YIM 10]